MTSARALLERISPWPWMINTDRGAITAELSDGHLVVSASEGRGWRTVKLVAESDEATLVLDLFARADARAVRPALSRIA